MRRIGNYLLTSALVLAALPAIAEAERVAERIQVIYDAGSGEVQRRLVRVIDLSPEAGLEFNWEPAKSAGTGLDPEGFASGAGVLTWRIPGTAAYDPRAFFSRYSGQLLRGAPHGQGRLLLRDGSWMEGIWREGRLHGKGRWQKEDGSQYEGSFEAGLPEGIGVLHLPTGFSYRGSFHRGLPHGMGTWSEPGGKSRAVVMVDGVEQRPSDAEVLPAQAGGDASRVTLSVVTNSRIALQQDLSYVHYNDGETLHLLPSWSGGDSQELIDLWSGTLPIPDISFYDNLSATLAANTRAFLDVALATNDGQKVKLDGLDLAVDYSAPHLKPFLAIRSAYTCIGHRPWFDLVNFGYGPVEEPRLKVSFGHYDTSGGRSTVAPVTDWVEVPMTGFGEGQTVFLGEALRQLGVDVETLAGNRFTCPSQDSLHICAGNLLASVPMGQLEGLVDADLTLTVPFTGELTYHWLDAWGQRVEAVEYLHSSITLAQLEVDSLIAEYGDGGAFAAPAPEFQDIFLPVPSAAARINLPLRGNPNVASATANIQLHANQNSVHALHVEARLGDGSVQNSMPMLLYFLAPREAKFETEARPGACFLRPDF